MSFWARAFRATAMFLVLFAAVEILACDFLPSSDCYISSQSSQQQKGQPPSSCDNCLCCCAHIVVVKPLIFEPQVSVVKALLEENAAQPLFSPSHIDHPPQLS
jgi:hypothetical protein